MEYRDDEDRKYYSSDLSKWIDKNCTHEMTSINLDILQYKRSCGRFRFIEYKHSNEGMKTGQSEVLSKISRWNIPELEVYIIYGDYPFDDVKIKRVKDNKVISVNNEQLIKFLNFEIVDLE